MVPKSATGLEVLALLIQWLHVLGFEGGGRDKKREFIQFASERKKKLCTSKNYLNSNCLLLFNYLGFPSFCG